MPASCTNIDKAIQAKIKELPPLPTVVTRLLKIMGDEQSSADDITMVLSSDQALAGQVLKLVNSSFYGMPGQISTISRAVVILGHSAVRNLATSLAVAGAIKEAGTVEERQRFWDHAVTTAAAADVLARNIDYPDPEEAFVAGLLHDLGHLLLAMAVPEEYAAVTACGPDGLVQREQESLGTTHARAGQKLLRRWKLPDRLCGAVRFHHTSKVITGPKDPLTSLVALADVLAGVHGIPYERSLDDGDLRALLKRTQLAPENLGEILANMTERIAETKAFLQVADEALDAEGADGDPDKARRVVLICSEPVRTAWAGKTLAHFGHQIVAAKAFCAGETEADIVLLDPAAVGADILQRLGPILARSGASVFIYGEDDEDRTAVLGLECRVLPLAFSRTDLA